MTTDDVFDLEHGSHISGSTTAVIVRWVRGQLGNDGVSRLLAEAREERPVEAIEDVSEWSSYRQATRLLEAAVQVTGRDDAARRIGEEMLVQHRETAVAELLRSLGSPEALLRSVAETSSKFSTIFSIAPEQVEQGRATVVGVTPPGVPRHRLLCDFTTGLLSIIPTVFGLAAAVITQTECQARGGSRCVYLLSWGSGAGDEESVERQRVHLLETQLQAAQVQLGALRATAVEVATAPDIETALELVMRRAGAAVRAPRYLLAVQMPGEVRLRVHSSGLTAQEAEQLAPTLLEQQTTTSMLVTQVASTTRTYGVLVAMFAATAGFFRQEEEILASYAHHAATALDTAWAIEDARRQNTTARALLDLSRALADVTGHADVAQRLASAIPTVVSCDSSTVLLWDEGASLLRLAGSQNIPPAVAHALAHDGIGLDSTPALSGMLAQPAPLFLHLDGGDAYLRDVLRSGGSAAAVVVPILAGDRFLGVLTAGVATETTRLERNSDLLERLEGLAHQAATALMNARLVTELQKRALQDPLTGLGNRTALADDLTRALARAARDGTECALLFLDLDRFKLVNDSYGHLAGDELLVQVTQRLRSTLRGTDSIARLGGDEFAVLLPLLHRPDDAIGAASRILTVMSQPFRLTASGDEDVDVGVSIGISFGHRGSVSSVDVMRDADAAMYVAKAAGGGVHRTAAASAQAPRSS